MTEHHQSITGTSSVSCRLTFDVETPATIATQVAVARRPGVRYSERLDVTSNGSTRTADELVSSDGGRQHVIHAVPGSLTIDYQASIDGAGGLLPEQVTEVARIAALRPSRYCPSDRLDGFAGSHFGALPTALDQVRAVCAYVWQHVHYEASVNDSSTDAVDTLLSGRGVCRDFAHLVATLCRAVGVPARIAAVYPPGLSPMDFHAVVETAIDGRWWVWDATKLAPRHTLVRIGTGRDAADIAFATVLSGRAEFSSMEISAVAAGDLPADDHDGLVALG